MKLSTEMGGIRFEVDLDSWSYLSEGESLLQAAEALRAMVKMHCEQIPVLGGRAFVKASDEVGKVIYIGHSRQELRLSTSPTATRKWLDCEYR